MPSDEKIQKVVREAKAEDDAIRSVIGIPQDYRPLRTLYNAPADTVIASVEQQSSDRFERRLFVRRTSERTYRPVGAPPSEIHYDQVLTSASHPCIYYTVRRVTQCEHLSGFGSDWESVDRFDLERKTVDTVVARDTMQLPEPYAFGWVSSLYGVEADDSAIYCSCGFQGPEKGKVDYWLCSVKSHIQVVTLLSKLEAVWF